MQTPAQSSQADSIEQEPVDTSLNGLQLQQQNESASRQAKTKWLQERIAFCIDYVGNHRRHNQRNATLVKIAAIVFAGAATILLGLKTPGLEGAFKDAAFVLTALTTTLASIEPFFNYRALWVEHERAKYRFHRLQDQLTFEVVGSDSSGLSIERLEWFHSKYQEIWVELSETWLSQRQSNRYNA